MSFVEADAILGCVYNWPTVGLCTPNMHNSFDSFCAILPRSSARTSSPSSTPPFLLDRPSKESPSDGKDDGPGVEPVVEVRGRAV
jgi:hypothetical protein